MSIKKITEKLITLDRAGELVKSHFHIVTDMAVSEPKGFFENLAHWVKALTNVTVYCANPSIAYPCFKDETLQNHLDLVVMFLTEAVRREQNRGVVHYIPQHLSQWSKNIINSGPIDIFWGSCTPPDERGFVALGPTATYGPEIIKIAKTTILEINPRLPTVLGATHIPITWVNYFIEYEHAPPTVKRPAINDIDKKIAEYVADLIEDESTIQLGIGSIPNAIGAALQSKKDLGVHTEMFNDTLMDLALKGVITGRKKTMWENKMVAAFVLGSEALYRFVAHNPVIELQPASLVNDPYRIGRNYKMVSINTAVECDITGQVCSESIGHKELSGVGGASDTHVGAQRSPGGKGIVAIPSTTKDGQSKIVCELKHGAKVSISRNDVDTIVTEYGIAKLAGKSVSQRAKALIAITHPQFRSQLLSDAKKFDYI